MYEKCYEYLYIQVLSQILVFYPFFNLISCDNILSFKPKTWLPVFKFFDVKRNFWSFSWLRKGTCDMEILTLTSAPTKYTVVDYIARKSCQWLSQREDKYQERSSFKKDIVVNREQTTISRSRLLGLVRSTDQCDYNVDKIACIYVQWQRM